MTQLAQAKMPIRIACAQCPLRSLEHFRSFSERELAFMTGFKIGEFSAGPGASILKEQTNSAHLYTVLQGWAFRYKQLADGRRQILNFALPGDLLGLQTSMFGEMDHSVEALTGVTLCVFARERFWQLFEAHPGLGFDVTWLSTQEERTLGQYLTAVGQRSARSRLAFVLLQLYRRCEPTNMAGANRMPAPFTQQHLADLLGLWLVHTNKTIRRLADEGLLSWKKGVIEFLDRDFLVELAEIEDKPVPIRPFI